MSVKVELSGRLEPEEAMKIIRAHIEKSTGKKVHACYGTARLRRNDTPYGEDSYPEFSGVEFRFAPEEIGG
jgi:hypothetical protein